MNQNQIITDLLAQLAEAKSQVIGRDETIADLRESVASWQKQDAQLRAEVERLQKQEDAIRPLMSDDVPVSYMDLAKESAQLRARVAELEQALQKLAYLARDRTQTRVTLRAAIDAAMKGTP
jgi:cell division protein FtsB